jgi:hypothetical protein
MTTITPDRPQWETHHELVQVRQPIQWANEAEARAAVVPPTLTHDQVAANLQRLRAQGHSFGTAEDLAGM